MKHLLELALYKKSVELYSRALWGKGFVIKGLAGGAADAAPHSYLLDNEIYVPHSILVADAHVRYYRAAVTHVALHAMSDAGVFDPKELNLLQRTVIGLVEDLRLELSAIKQFPGLRNLWLDFHDFEYSEHISALRLMQRLSRSVLDPKYEDNHQWVRKGKQKILGDVFHYNEPGIAMEVGLSLANDLGQMRLPLNTGKFEQPVAYRDDNRCLWKRIIEHHQKSDSSTQKGSFSTQNARFIENNHGILMRISESSQDQEEKGFHLRQNSGDDLEYQQLTLPESDSSSTYPEWDYRTQVLKQDWCNIRDYTSSPGLNPVIDEIYDRHKHILKRLQRMATRLRVEKQQWQRKVEDGDDYDLMYVIDAVVAARTNKIPDNRVYIRKALLKEKNLAISILLDLSESTNELAEGGRESISQIMRDAVYLLCETLSIVGDRFSVAGFSSDGRRQVNYIRFKSFEEGYESIKNRLASITGKYSTRLGTAIRHSANELAQQPEKKKLLLVITDGAPSDIDVFDKNYLIQDCWYAVRTLGQYGIRPFCINLDRNADNIIEHVFGQGRSETLDHVTRLPDLLAHLYMRYMHAG